MTKPFCTLVACLLISGCYNFNNPAELGVAGDDDGADGTETVLFEADFNAFGNGASGAAAGFSLDIHNPGSSSVTVVAMPTESDHSLRLRDLDSNGVVRAERNLTNPISGRFRLSFDLREPLIGAQPTIEILSPGGSVAVRLHVNGARRLWYFNGSYIQIATLNSANFHQIVIDGDPASQTYSLILDGSEEVTDAPMVESVPSVGTFSFESDHGALGSSYIDNVRFSAWI